MLGFTFAKGHLSETQQSEHERNKGEKPQFLLIYNIGNSFPAINFESIYFHAKTT